MSDDCSTCLSWVDVDYMECRECGAHFATIIRDHRGLCFECRDGAA